MKRLLGLLVAAAALALASSAGAVTIDDLRALGYTISVSNPGSNGCPIYYVTGHGISEYFACNDQPTIDSLANPAAICNAEWQANHPDQFKALNSLTSKGYVVSGDQCADLYNVTNPNTGQAVYSGAGAGLVNLDATIGVTPAGTTTGTVATSPTTCLPLCTTPTSGQTATTSVPGVSVGTVSPTGTQSPADSATPLIRVGPRLPL